MNIRVLSQNQLRAHHELTSEAGEATMSASDREKLLSPLVTVTGRFEPALLEAAAQQQVQDEAQMESDCTFLCSLPQPGEHPHRMWPIRRILPCAHHYTPSQ